MNYNYHNINYNRILMIEAITISERRPSALRSALRKAFGPSRSSYNFVRPNTQVLDPTFPCPCCSEKLTVPISQAGKKARCRHCYQPIRICDPKRRQAATDLSRDLDPLSRPSDYPLCGHRASTMDYVPRGAVAVLPLLLLVGFGILLVSLLPKGNAKLGLTAALSGPTPVQLIESPAVNAEQLVSSFLSAEDWTHSVASVHDGLSVAGDIAALNKHLPEGGFKTSSQINKDGTATVCVNFADGSLTHFQVAEIGGEQLIVWESNPGGMRNQFDESRARMVGMPELEPK